MNIIVYLLGYGLITVFGILLSIEFSGINPRNNIWKISVFSLIALMLQALTYISGGIEFSFKIYPLITHLLLIVFIAAVFKAFWLKAFVSVLCTYLFCQIPAWIADTVYLFSDNRLYRSLLFAATILISYGLLHHYAVKPAQRLLSGPWQSVAMLGIIPFIYYIFDYVTTIYTDLLYSGNHSAVQFMPLVTAIFYFFFLLAYSSSLERNEKTQRERDLLSLQLNHSQTEIVAMRQMQEQARQYRHDLRHHVSLLLGFAESEDIQKIKDYLHDIQQDLDVFTPVRFCGNDVVDLILSYFSAQAKLSDVQLSVDVHLPSHLPFDAPELCSLLSNGLENAILAAVKVSDPAERIVSVNISIRQKNFLLSVKNPYVDTVLFENGIPYTKEKDHGFGTKNIISIVNSHDGQVFFSANDNTFTMQVILPIDD